MRLTNPTTTERSADFIGQVFQSLLGQGFVLLAVVALELGVLTGSGAAFLAAVVFVVFAGVATWVARVTTALRHRTPD